MHPLRAAAAWLGAERRPSSPPLVSLDDRLRAAASREGFLLVDLDTRAPAAGPATGTCPYSTLMLFRDRLVATIRAARRGA